SVPVKSAMPTGLASRPRTDGSVSDPTGTRGSRTNHSRADCSRRIHELIECEKERTSSPASAQRYARQHARRFDYTFDLCCQLVPDTSSVVCDVGRSSFTERLAGRYADVWSLGFGLQEDDGGHRELQEIHNSRHIVFNLNASRDVSSWPICQVEFDL